MTLFDVALSGNSHLARMQILPNCVGMPGQ